MIPDVALTYDARSSLAAMMQGLGQLASVTCVTVSGVLVEQYPFKGYFYTALLVLPIVVIPRLIGVVSVRERKYVKREKGKEEEKEKEKGKEEEKEKEKGEENSTIGVQQVEMAPYSDPTNQATFAERVRKFFQFWRTDGRDFALVALTCLLYAIASSMVMGNLIFFLRFVFSISKVSVALFLHTFSSIVSIPFWFFVMTRVGKNATFYVSGVATALSMAALAAAPSDSSETLVFSLIFLFGFLEAASLILQAMIPDSVQSYVRATGRRDEAFLYSISLLSFKFGQAIGFSLSSVILGFVGYSPYLLHQPDSVLLALRWNTFGFPALCVLVGILLIMGTTDFSKEENRLSSVAEGEKEEKKKEEVSG